MPVFAGSGHGLCHDKDGRLMFVFGDSCHFCHRSPLFLNMLSIPMTEGDNWTYVDQWRLTTAGERKAKVVELENGKF